MIKSMTGFGRAEVQEADRKFTVEIKSVNHRYLDFNIRIPKKFGFFDSAVRNVLKEYMQRGKVDVFITCEDYSQADSVLKYQKHYAEQYLTFFRQMEEDFGIPNDVTVTKLGHFPEVFAVEESSVDEKELWSLLEKALREACVRFSESRAIEGEKLRADLTGKLEFMRKQVAAVEERSPQILAEYRSRLEEKMHELLAGSSIEESRIASEVILFADKICTDEETVRLRSHIDHMEQVLAEGAGIGRKLDFIAQEMNREANTILSKANDLTTSNLAIDLKTEIEKVREQIQNIE